MFERESEKERHTHRASIAPSARRSERRCIGTDRRDPHPSRGERVEVRCTCTKSVLFDSQWTTRTDLDRDRNEKPVKGMGRCFVIFAIFDKCGLLNPSPFCSAAPFLTATTPKGGS